jgi:hypothetical protein
LNVLSQGKETHRKRKGRRGSAALSRGLEQ